MVGLILVLLLCTVLAGAVLGYVAWQARLDGRQILTETGEEALSGLRRRAGTATERRRRVADESPATSADVAEPVAEATPEPGRDAPAGPDAAEPAPTEPAQQTQQTQQGAAEPAVVSSRSAA